MIILNTNFSCGDRIRELRTERGLSQERLALDADITPAYLGLVERGKRNATVVIIERICDAMGVSLAEFFTVECPPKPQTDDLSRQILAQVACLNEDEKNAFLHLTKNIIQFRQISIKAKLNNK